jgi:hypothetical protein
MIHLLPFIIACQAIVGGPPTTQPSRIFEKRIDAGQTIVVEWTPIKARPRTNRERHDPSWQFPETARRYYVLLQRDEGVAHQLWRHDSPNPTPRADPEFLHVLDAKMDGKLLVIVYSEQFMVNAQVIAPDVAGDSVLVSDYGTVGGQLLVPRREISHGGVSGKIDGSIAQDNLTVTIQGNMKMRFVLRRDGDAYRWERQGE